MLSIDLLIDVWVVSKFGPLNIAQLVLWTYVSLLLEKYLEVQLIYNFFRY